MAVSGGADSLALALLAADWGARQGGEVHALVVDHGLRAESAREAAVTAGRLAGIGLAASVLTLAGLRRGPGLADRARTARLAALCAAARDRGMLHLLLGHHSGDQAETLVMRQASGSGPDGMAGMAALRETEDVRLLRPLLGFAPGRLRDLLRARGICWVEDPSNADATTGRGAARALLADPAGDGARVMALGLQAVACGRDRAARDAGVAGELGRRVAVSPLGYAVLPPDLVSAAALGAIWQAVSGRGYPPAARHMARIAASPGPVCLAGVRLLPAGRLGPGWLLVREGGGPSVPAVDGARWDGFRLAAAGLPGGCELGALGDAALGIPRALLPPACVRAMLPAIRRGGTVLAVPLLGIGDPALRTDWSPAVPAAGGAFVVGAGDA